MIADCNVRLLSLYGYLEFVDGKLEFFRTAEGVKEHGDPTAPARIHIHRDGLTILGLPPEALEHLERALLDAARKTPEKRVSIRINTTGG